MARRSQPSQKSQKSQTQQTLDVSGKELNLNFREQAEDVVRYLIFRGGDKGIISKSEITRHVIPRAGRNYEEIMGIARNILQNVYGYNLIIVDSQGQRKAKGYVVSNGLKYIKGSIVDQEDTVPKDKEKVLLLLILTHIFMSNDEVTENSLYEFLKNFKLDVENKHPTFGSISDYITRITKEHYIVKEMDEMSKRHSFRWGARAESEISKLDILKFVCRIYNDTAPKSWESQYTSATQQNCENNKVGIVEQEEEASTSDEPMEEG